MELLKTFLNGYAGYAGYLWYEVTHPTWHNYFYWLIGVSLFFFSLERLAPWRKNQPRFRKDFWLDFFYMFFNFFLFSLIIYNAASDVVVRLFNDGIKYIFQFDLQASNPMNSWPMWAILLTGFLVRDFVQWWVHRLLHRLPFLWNFHKVHHSVEQMGFAAHLRYHWMENVVYRSIEYIPLALMGIGLYDFFIIHIFALSIGHYNHSNITVDRRISGAVLGAFIGIIIASGSLDIHLLNDYSILVKLLAIAASTTAGYFVIGPFMKHIFNSPEMHIWHHAAEMPADKPYGINFGISLAIWDYLFGTARIPAEGRDIVLGFDGLNEFPADFIGQNKYGF
ncbi:MAG: sterol desaturase family protein [Saprospiraceae bacterium]|nr:sterol desaturase family protein [Saprospiraceae bacterium]